MAVPCCQVENRPIRGQISTRTTSKLNPRDTRAVIRELLAVLPAQQEHVGLPPIHINLVAGAKSSR